MSIQFLEVIIYNSLYHAKKYNTQSVKSPNYLLNNWF